MKGDGGKVRNTAFTLNIWWNLIILRDDFQVASQGLDKIS
jgi:hypothetical protein